MEKDCWWPEERHKSPHCDNSSGLTQLGMRLECCLLGTYIQSHTLLQVTVLYGLRVMQLPTGHTAMGKGHSLELRCCQVDEGRVLMGVTRIDIIYILM